ncbi:hypothetical protein EDD92_7389 [Streptomyces sp. TLI_185]|nr:hypothetical protein EDD92_7389 [Streptomyces sp. TLI_185]
MSRCWRPCRPGQPAWSWWQPGRRARRCAPPFRAGAPVRSPPGPGCRCCTTRSSVICTRCPGTSRPSYCRPASKPGPHRGCRRDRVPVPRRRPALPRSPYAGHMDGVTREHRRRVAARCAHRPAPRGTRPDRPRQCLSVGCGGCPRTRGAGRLLVHHVRPQPARPQPHPWLLGPADRGDGPTPQCPGLPTVPLGAAPPFRRARTASARPREHPPATQPGLHLTAVPACRRGLRPVLPVRRPQHRRPTGRPVLPRRPAAGPGAVRLAGHCVQRRPPVAAQPGHRARPAGRHRDRLHRADRPRSTGSVAGQRARPPLRAPTGGAGPRGAVRHPRRDEQRQRGHVRRGSTAGGPPGCRSADGGPARRRARRRPVDPYPGRRKGLGAPPRPATAPRPPIPGSRTPGTEPPDRNGVTYRTAVTSRSTPARACRPAFTRPADSAAAGSGRPRRPRPSSAAAGSSCRGGSVR